MNNPIERAFADRLRALDAKATAGPWQGYSEPEVGLPYSLFSGIPMQSGFGPLEPLTGYDIDLVTLLRNSVPAILAMAEENARLIAIEAAAQRVIASASTLDPDLPEDANVYAPYLADLRRALGKDHANAQG